MLPFITVYVFGTLDLGDFNYATADPTALILTLSVSFPAFLNAASAIVRERAQGTLARLSKTPAPLFQFAFGKLVANSTLAVAQAFIALVTAVAVIPAVADLDVVFLLVTLVLFGIACHAFGLMLSALSGNDVQANQLVSISLLVMFVLAGFLKPISDLGAVLGPLARGLPIVEGYQALFHIMRNNELAGGWVLALAANAVVSLGVTVALLRFRKTH